MPTSQRARADRPWRTLVLVWQHRPCVSLAVQRIPRKGDTSSSKLLVIGEIVVLFRRALTVGEQAFTLSLLASQSCDVRPRLSKRLGLRH